MDALDRLRDIAILAHFGAPQLSALAESTAGVRYAEGETIFEEGGDSQEAFLIESGSVRIQRKTPYGEYTLAVLEAGQLFGEGSFVDGNPRSGEAVVLTDSVLFPLHPVTLGSIGDRDKRFTMALYWMFWKSLSAKLRATNEKLAQFFSKGEGAAAEPAAVASEGSAVSVGLDAKRNLFREQKLSTMEINFLSSLSRETRLESGEVLFREGQPGDRMYVVLEGRVMISKRIPGAGEEALAILERGDYFGEMALIDHQPRSADAKAHEGGATMLSISREVLEGILDIQKVSSLGLLRLLCDMVAKRLREIDDKLIGWHIFAAGSGESLDVPR